ncbi:MAG: hypothetical protein IH964_12695, partial [Candidatus Dadabacteria bacterium]|nr:hypothetical protein [Candidatus Dadabacteria bacterium]
MENKLTDIRNPNELASFLGIEYSRHLIYHIYVVPEDERYVNFEIPKRSGGKRKISAPRIHLKTIQTLLAEKLEEIFGSNKTLDYKKFKNIIEEKNSDIYIFL